MPWVKMTLWGGLTSWGSDWGLPPLSSAPSRVQHTLSTHQSTHPVNTLCQHTLSIHPLTHPVNTPCQRTQSTHPLHTVSQHTLSTHPVNTPPCWYVFAVYVSIHLQTLDQPLTTFPFNPPPRLSLNPSSQPILSTHPLNRSGLRSFFCEYRHVSICLGLWIQWRKQTRRRWRRGGRSSSRRDWFDIAINSSHSSSGTNSSSSSSISNSTTTSSSISAVTAPAAAPVAALAVVAFLSRNLWRFLV